MSPSADSGLRPAVQATAGRVSLAERVRAHGKFFVAGEAKHLVRGVTYGPFRPQPDGSQYGSEAQAADDLAQIAAAGFNTVRTYTMPPRWFLDRAAEAGLRVFAGAPWEQHVAFLDSAATRRRILKDVARAAAELRGHPAAFALAVGNEIPAPIVRLYGAKRIAAFVGELADAAKQDAPETQVTYVNYPTTEYLELPALDFMCFNVYLESEATWRAYLRRLQNLAGERPLVLGELGLDSRRNGMERQAEVLGWQIRAAFETGCAGAFAYAWTDEWHRGGYDIEDWDFGLTTRDRRPKPALAAVKRAFAEAPFGGRSDWPRISVVVCSYNGSRTIRDTLDHLQRVDYPDFEVIVVNDGSKDDTRAIAEGYPGVRVISTENRGLSAARNTGAEAATGEIVAYTDDDAYPDPHWLRFIALGFMDSNHVGIGGPNIAPYDDGFIAQCVAAAPGGPLQVLITDELAEHIPGCNMSFRKSAWEAVGGFDARYRAAGDDVDFCWRLQDKGWTIGFHPGAMVWHHRRNSARMFWRQQIGYGKAESLLEEKWPERYNPSGHLHWEGRIYGPGPTRALMLPEHVYHGPWGSAFYQGLYRGGPTALTALPLMPEWYLLLGALAAVGIFGFSWSPLWWALAAAVAGGIVSCIQAVASARHSLDLRLRGGSKDLRAVVLAAYFHLMQPVARLKGRLKHGLTLWRKRARGAFRFPWHRTVRVWDEHWAPVETRLSAVQAALREAGNYAASGGSFDGWDLEVRSGLLGGARVTLAPEEHGAGKQNLIFRVRPFAAPTAQWVFGILAVLAVLAATHGGAIAALALGAAALGVAGLVVEAAGLATGAIEDAIARYRAGIDQATSG
jgi:GT2 family glycosyltransferase